ncbi:hypothetical protein [Desertibaculum subflavum]|uniref:hypothetical protein n=1 Tax=Desertibaculum subflavum TaxID=2268458 RepID=UPI0013C4B52C
MQESRFMLLDGRGIAHLCVLSPEARLEPERADNLRRSGTKVHVRYEDCDGVIGHRVSDVTVP